jgi:dinuclear metal center YbgI/SA1388 family protein
VAPLSTLIDHLDELLEPRNFEDFGPNGVQISSPRGEVASVVTGVSATRAFIEQGIEAGADLLLVHHGVFWGSSSGLDPVVAERLRPLFKHDVALAAYHLPLDAHPEVGNNALLARALDCEGHEAFADIGRAARFGGDGVSVAELLGRVRAATGGREPLLQGAGPERVRRLAIVSGGGASYLARAAAGGCDGLLTGEPRENVMGEAEELGVHFIAAGHYATEVAGIRRLGELLAERFGVEHAFLELPNPV